MDQHRFSSLILAKLNNSISESDDQELLDSIKSNEIYANQYRFFMEYWNNEENDLTHSQRLFEDLSSRIAAEESKHHFHPGKRSKQRIYIAAASIIVLFAATLIFFKGNTPGQKSEAELISTSLSSKKTITLEDGTIIRLNGNSSLSNRRLSARSREITLTGEAYFSVAKDHHRPFIVHTEKMDIKVLGTEFNVRAYPDQQHQTALIEGAIKITLHDARKSVVFLRPNDKLTVELDVNKHELEKVEHYSNADATEVMETAWLRDELVFRDQSFETLAVQLEVRYGLPIVFQSENVKNYRFNGTFKKETLQQVLYILSRTGTPFSYNIENGKVYIN
jgi:transmembrane sensor